MPLDFPNSPSNGDTYNAGGKTWSYNGSVWSLVGVSVNATPADDSITTAKIADANVTTAKIAANAITQAKLAANLSAVTVTTTANRDTDIPSPFTGQLAVLTDTSKVQLYNGTSWISITMAPAEAPTSLSAVASTISVAISFTLGADNGSAISNHKYAISTDGGSTYGSFTALNPVDITSPITISGLSMNTQYYVKLKTVNGIGDSLASAAVSFTTEGVANTPTSLSASNVTGSTVDIAFTAGAANGSSITNYKYAVSTDDVTYGSFTALSPADASTPITVTGLTDSTAQYIKLKAVNGNGDSAASASVSFTTLATPGAPTSLSAGSITATSVVISFTAGAQNGSAITNYQYALSTDSGSTYGSFTALNPVDATTPITVTGLTAATSYYIKLKAVNNSGAGTESSAVTLTTTNPPPSVDYLVVAGGGAGGTFTGGITGGGGGAGGYRTAASFAVSANTNYTVTVGGAGSTSTFSSITSTQGGGGGKYVSTSASAGGGGGSGGGASGAQGNGSASGGAGTAGQGNSGGTGGIGGSDCAGGGGGGASGAGGANSGQSGGGGGGGSSSSYSGASVGYASGGSSSNNQGGNLSAGAANTGNGGGTGASGGSGIVIVRYANTYANATVSAGLTYTGPGSVAGYKTYSFTAGSGTVSWA